MQLDADVVGLARERAAAQRPDAGLTHRDDEGGLAVAVLLARAGTPYVRAGENLARAQSGASPIAVEQALMLSPTHRANILEPAFDRLAVGAALPDTDRALLSRAHEAMGRILAFLDRDAEAMKEFDAAISMGDIAGGALKDALEGKKKLSQPK